MSNISKRNRRREREIRNAAKNRREIIAARLNRRDMIKAGLLTSAGYLIQKNGLVLGPSSAAAAASAAIVIGDGMTAPAEMARP